MELTQLEEALFYLDYLEGELLLVEDDWTKWELEVEIESIKKQINQLQGVLK